jgi:hypothetical protein
MTCSRTRWRTLGLAVAALGLTLAGLAVNRSRSTTPIASLPPPAFQAPVATVPPGIEATARGSAPTVSPANPTLLAVADRHPSCRACEDQNRGGLCFKDMGCQGLTDPDKGLCEKLLRCLDQHPECSAKNPALCYCGTAQGMECLRAPNGPCRHEALAAAKTSDLMEGAKRFFVPAFPSGRASQVAACHVRACRDECLGVEL